METNLHFWMAASLSLLFCAGARAQENAPRSMPDSVYYLMPSFGQGVVYITGQSPAQGKLNICAIDHTLRFLDKDGKELEASNQESITMVRISGVLFVQDRHEFYRMHPLTEEMGVAVLRTVKVIRDVKPGAYGTTSQTTAVREYGSLYADGVNYQLGSEIKSYPYTLSETFFLYQGHDIMDLNKKNLRKLFPQKKDEINAWFKEGHSLPDTLNETLELLSGWLQ